MKPVYIEAEDYTDPTFRDMLTTELLRHGLNVVDNRNEDCTIVHVNAKMAGQMVSTATCRVLDSAGGIGLSMSVTNPQPYNTIYIGNKSTESIIRDWSESISR
jgi:hypothetical protein